MRRKVEPLLCELHAHTTWSDGALTVSELVDLYGRSGFDVLCVTAAHAVAVGCRAFVDVDEGIDAALLRARAEGAALIAAHPFRSRRGVSGGRLTLRFAREWRRYVPLVDRWELFNRYDLFGWVADRGLPVVANGDFHRPEHLYGWKTLLPCAKVEQAVLGYLRSPRPAFLSRIDAPVELPDAA